MGTAFRTDNGDMCNSEMFAYGQMHSKRLCVSTKKRNKYETWAQAGSDASYSHALNDNIRSNRCCDGSSGRLRFSGPPGTPNPKPVQFGRGAHSVNNEATNTMKDE